jgi:NADH:ubiquinone oxidoreductase subunit D
MMPSQLRHRIEESNQLNRLTVQNEQLRNKLRIVSQNIDQLINTKINMNLRKEAAANLPHDASAMSKVVLKAKRYEFSLQKEHDLLA